MKQFLYLEVVTLNYDQYLYLQPGTNSQVMFPVAGSCERGLWSQDSFSRNILIAIMLPSTPSSIHEL
jgi:hypothetical protein